MAHKHGFKSQAQWRYCFANQARHPTWNCHKEAHKTKGGKRVRYRRLPRRR